MSGKGRLSTIRALHKKVQAALVEQGDADNVDLANDIFRKFLTVSAASRLEEKTKETIRELVRNISGQPGKILLDFIERNVLKRSYHTLFDWDSENANRFYSSFGGGFRDFMKEKEGEDEDFANAAKSFVALGRERNQLVHSDLAVADFQWSESDVEDKIRQADFFLPKFLRYALEYAGGGSVVGESPPPAP